MTQHINTGVNKMNKQDLTQYSDSELSMVVFNDEYLYNMRHKPYLKYTLDELFIYTPDQLDELENDLMEEMEGEEA